MKTLILAAALITSLTTQAARLKLRYHRNKTFTVGQESFEYRKRVVVIDSGASFGQLNSSYMCRDTAQVSFNESIKPNHPHGENIVSIISNNIDLSEYCITMVKVKPSKGREVVKALILVGLLKRAFVVNLSLEHLRFKSITYNIIRNLIMYKGIRFNVAAGNSSKDLDSRCDNYYACYAPLLKAESARSLVYRDSIRNPRKYFKVIGARAGYSNRGEVVDRYLYGGLMGNPPMRGTSMATALYTNMMVRIK